MKELRVIRDVAAKFGYLLLINSNTSFNKFIEPYLNKLIDEEHKMLSVVRDYPRTNLELLQRMKESHDHDVMSLYQDILNEVCPAVSLEDIPALRRQLLVLKHAGPQFRQMLHGSSLVEQQAFVYQDRNGLDLTNSNVSD